MLESTKAFAVPQQEEELLRKFYRLPACDGFPLAMAAVSGQHTPTLTTVSFLQVAIPADTFDLPAGYKQAITETGVWLSNDVKAKVNDFAELLDEPGRR